MKYLFAFILSTSMLFTGIVGCSSSTPTVTEETILATSGDDTILLSEFLLHFASIRNNQNMFLEMFGFTEEQMMEYWTDESEGISQLDMTKEYALEHAIDNATLYILATEAGYTYDPDQLQQIENEINDIVIQLTSPETRGEDAFFDMFMVTPQQAIELQKIDLTVAAYADSLFDSISLTEEEVLATYEENQESLDGRLHYHATVRHVLIASNEDMTDEERSEATERANEILSRVEAGEDIEELAILYSDDPGVIENNGLYADFHRGDMLPEFDEWAFSSQPGDIGMVQTVHGYHIMYSVHVDTIEDVYEELEYLVREIMFWDMIERMIEESGIEWIIDHSVIDSVSPF